MVTTKSDYKINIEHDFQGQIFFIEACIHVLQYYKLLDWHLQFACILNTNANDSYILGYLSITKYIRTTTRIIRKTLPLCSNTISSPYTLTLIFKKITSKRKTKIRIK